MNNTNVKLLIGIKETARLLDLAPQTVYNMVSKKTFPVKSVRVGRLVKFRLSDIKQYVETLPAI